MVQDIAEDFANFFRMVAANTPDLLEDVFRLRYQVYCLETGFEKPENFPEGLERDKHDDRSEHYLIQHIKTGSFAATTRLILPDTENPELPLPIEQHCRIDRTDILESIPRHRLAEVSRFCVSKNFKRRAGEPGTTVGQFPHYNQNNRFSDDERRVFPHITLALFACLVRMNLQHDITHWYAVMEPALIRFLTHLGIIPTPIGPETNYHGKRQPCIFEIQHQLDSVKEKNRQVWNLLTDYGRFWQSDAQDQSSQFH